MKSLLIGESAAPAEEQAIVDTIEADPQVERLIHLRTQHLGPEELLVAAKVEAQRDHGLGAGLCDRRARGGESGAPSRPPASSTSSRTCSTPEPPAADEKVLIGVSLSPQVGARRSPAWARSAVSTSPTSTTPQCPGARSRRGGDRSPCRRRGRRRGWIAPSGSAAAGDVPPGPVADCPLRRHGCLGGRPVDDGIARCGGRRRPDGRRRAARRRANRRGVAGAARSSTPGPGAGARPPPPPARDARRTRCLRPRGDTSAPRLPAGPARRCRADRARGTAVPQDRPATARRRRCTASTRSWRNTRPSPARSGGRTSTPSSYSKPFPA